MKTETNRRAIDSTGNASEAMGSLGNGPAWVLIRVPDLKPASIGAAVESVVSQPLPETPLKAEEPMETSAPKPEPSEKSDNKRKQWRNDAKHEPFRPEKFRSGVATKLVAGMLSMGAIALVYYALFGGAHNPPGPEDDWAAEAIDDSWTNDDGELEVDLGMESEIGESSPIAPAFAAEAAPGEQRPWENAVVEASNPAPWSPAEPEIPAEQPEPTRSSLSDMLPWNNEQPATPEQGTPTPAYRAETDTYQPAGDPILNAPLTQAAPTYQGYANQTPAGNPPAGPQYPTTGAPEANYPTTGAGSEYQLPAGFAPPSYQPRQADQRSAPTSTYGSGQPNYPTTGQPSNYTPSGYAPAAGNYPSTNQPELNTNTPRQWQR